MTVQRWTSNAGALALTLIAAPLAAQSRQLFTWTGRVDREVQITMRDRDVWSRGVGRDDDGRARTRVESALPRYAGFVRVETIDGRGDVDVVQQPNARNDYTTIIRVRDRSSGSDRYRLSAYWESYYSDDRGGWNNGQRGGAWGWGQGRGQGRDRDDSPRIEPRDRSRDDNGDWYGRSGTALHWSGAVDADVEIRLQGNRADYRSLSGAGTRDVRSDVVGAGLPRRDLQLAIDQRQGRGTITIVQQPTAYNGYTAVIRVHDPQGGFGYYDFLLTYR
jgi:hypothetical protein